MPFKLCTAYPPAGTLCENASPCQCKKVLVCKAGKSITQLLLLQGHQMTAGGLPLSSLDLNTAWWRLTLLPNPAPTLASALGWIFKFTYCFIDARTNTYLLTYESCTCSYQRTISQWWLTVTLWSCVRLKIAVCCWTDSIRNGCDKVDIQLSSYIIKSVAQQTHAATSWSWW